jgi:hypothetical protein
MSNRPVYLALPRLSVSTVLLNLPNILDLSVGPPPILLMDRADYNQTREDCIRDPDNQKAFYLMMAYEELRRRGIICLIDYADYYPSSIQDQYLQQNKELIGDMTTQVNRLAASKANDEWLKYARGEYQEPFRGSIGENESTFAALRRGEKKQCHKLECGTNDPMSWNEKVLSKGVAVLKICQKLIEKEPDLNIQKIVCSPQYNILNDFLTVADAPQADGSITDGLDIGHDFIDTNSAYLRRLEPHRRITSFTGHTVAKTRTVLDAITEIATRRSGVQFNDWFLLGPSLAVPRYDEIFDFDVISHQINNKLDTSQLRVETERIVETLNGNIDDGPSTNKLRYEYDSLAETYDLPTTLEMKQNRAAIEMMDYAFKLPNYSRELRSLVDEGPLTQAAGLVAVSIARDPQPYDEDDIQRRSLEVAARLDPHSNDVMTPEQREKERQGEAWRDIPNWFEVKGRSR